LKQIPLTFRDNAPYRGIPSRGIEGEENPEIGFGCRKSLTKNV
jgi:hypothetical protein